MHNHPCMGTTMAILLACALSGTAYGASLRAALPCLDQAGAQLQSQAGLFIVHRACDRTFFEIPPELLNRDMLANTEFAAASDHADEIAPGSQASSTLVRWARRGERVFLERVRYERWARNQDPLQRGIERVSLPVVIKAFPVVAEGEHDAPIVDITPLFTTQVGRGFALEFRRRFHMQDVDGARSYIERVKS